MTRIWSLLPGILFSCLPCSVVTGQDTTLDIHVVEVTAERLMHMPGQTLLLADSLESIFLHTSSLQEQFMLNPANHVRSYGPGRLATISARGSGSGQHSVSFQGLNLLNPLWGLVDYSQIPLFLFPSTGQLAGDQTSRAGSGSATGQSILGTGLETFQDPGLEAQVETGSFGTLKTGLGVHSVWKQKTRALARLVHDQAINDYPFRDRFGHVQTLTHARFQQQGFLVDASHQWSSSHQLDLTIWGLRGSREIPPTLAQQSSEAKQEDNLSRTLLRWQWRTKKWVGGIRTAFLTDALHYTDPASGELDNETRSRQAEFQAWATRSLTQNQAFFAEVGYRIIRGSSDHYADLPDESRTFLHIRYSWTPAALPLKIWVSHRSEQAARETAWSIPALGVELTYDAVQFRAHISRHNRWAAWDDRYWVPGGNPDIRPENGWAGESGITWKSQYSTGDLQLSIQGYYRQVNDWIQWTPHSGFWSTENLFHVRSQGLESLFSWSITPWLHYNGRYALTRSLRQDRDEQLVTHDRQLPYIPLHNFRQSIYFQQWGYTLRIRHQWTDAVSTLADGSEGLPAFHLIHLDFARTFQWGRQNYLVWARCENVLDHTYYLVRNLPLPGRQFSVGMRWTFE